MGFSRPRDPSVKGSGILVVPRVSGGVDLIGVWCRLAPAERFGCLTLSQSGK